MTDKRPLYETADYRIDLQTINVPAPLHPDQCRKYALSHKTHGVVAGYAEQFPAAIKAANELQAELDELSMQLIEKSAPIGAREVN